ncbi:hypothetical protein [Pseudoxanthomonas sp. SGT-18]|uniref:hypothetical protein n=1 Tax=Pseudoxanthomonas sp. SGT-18 TaxID=2493087 RepID=UPI000F62BD5D|nr:hypothetical protein [Pseudoxanthomonas sp. SGT-18]
MATTISSSAVTKIRFNDSIGICPDGRDLEIVTSTASTFVLEHPSAAATRKKWTCPLILPP